MKKVIAVMSTALLAVGLAGIGSIAASAEDGVDLDATPAISQELEQVAFVEAEVKPKVNVEAEVAVEAKVETQARTPRPDPVVQEPTPVTPIVEKTIKVYWQLPEGTNGNSPFDSIWPQDYLGESDADLQCGYTAQWDIYRFDTDADIAAVTALWADGILSAGPEDQGLHAYESAWGFVTAPDCEVVVPLEPVVTFDYSQTCGTLTMTATAANLPATRDWYYGPKALREGSIVGSAVQKNNGTATKTINFPEDSYGGSVDLVLETYAATEQDYLPAGWELKPTPAQHLVTIDTDCEVNVPEKPEPVAVVEVTEAEYLCDATEVTVYTKTTNVGHKLVDNVWVLNPLPSDRSKTVETTRDLTAEEMEGNECEVVIPPTEVPPTKTTPLAFTGPSDWAPFAGSAMLLLLVGGGLTLAGARRK